MENCEQVIAYGIDNGFTVPLVVSLASVLKNSNLSNLHVIVFFNGKVDPRNRSLIQKIGEKYKSKGRVSIREVELGEFSNFKVHSSQWTSSAFARLKMAGWLRDECSRFLYLDADTIVVNDLGDLFHLHMEGNSIAAAPDYLVHEVSFSGSISSPDFSRDRLNKGNYFNTGVMLIDIPQWIADRTQDSLCKILEQYGDFFGYMDQDALNWLIGPNYKSIGFEYNCVSLVYWKEYGVNKVNGPVPVSLEDVKIFHFAGHSKPWEEGLKSDSGKYYRKMIKDLDAFGVVGYKLMLTSIVLNTVKRKLRHLLKMVFRSGK